jgi:hypothetical protein
MLSIILYINRYGEAEASPYFFLQRVIDKTYLALQLQLFPHAPDAHLHTPLAQQLPSQLHLPSLQQITLPQEQVFFKQQLFSAANTRLALKSIDTAVITVTIYCFMVCLLFKI